MVAKLKRKLSDLRTDGTKGSHEQGREAETSIVTSERLRLRYCCGAVAVEAEVFTVGRRSESAVSLRIRFWKVTRPTR